MKRMSSNLIRHTLLLALYFASAAVLFLIENLAHLGAAVWPERGHFLFVGLLYAGWTVSMSTRGEESEPWPDLPAEVQDFIRDRNDFGRALGHHVRK
jgi:hypothetical protein